MLDLFFEEKDVEIVSADKTEKKVDNKKKLKKKNKRVNIINENIAVENEKSMAPMFLSSPFVNFQDFLSQDESCELAEKSSIPHSTGNLAFLEPGFSPFFISDFTSNRSYSEGLYHRQSELRLVFFFEKETFKMYF